MMQLEAPACASLVACSDHLRIVSSDHVAVERLEFVRDFAHYFVSFSSTDLS